MRVRSRMPRRHPPVARYRAELPPVTAASAPKALERLLLDNLLGFWDERVIDPRGGYRLAYDVRGRRRRDRRRYAVTQARTLWFFARLARSSYGEPRHLDWAAHGFDFLRERMWDRSHGGLFWEVDASGPSDARKHLYSHAFGLLALVEFHRASGDESALEVAQELFELVDSRAHDARFGGYLESFGRDWRSEPPSNTNPVGLPPDEKTVNGHMHWMSALAGLVEVSPADLPTERLRELVTIFGELGGGGSTGYPNRHREDWSPVPGWRCSFGHDVEAATLSMQACGVLGISGTTLLPVCQALWDNALEYGFDRERGGLYESGEPGRPADRLEKVWWVQAEGLLGARLMYARTGDRRYEDAFLRILNWIVRAQTDWERGDWHRLIASDGTVTGDKAGPWECPFHQGRALLECLAAMPLTPSSG